MKSLLGLSHAQFNELSLTLGIGGLMLFMAFVMYRLAKESGAGGFGTLVIALSLGLGLIGFIAKTIIQFSLDI